MTITQRLLDAWAADARTRANPPEAPSAAYVQALAVTHFRRALGLPAVREPNPTEEE
jgi:hypothetical protein